MMPNRPPWPYGTLPTLTDIPIRPVELGGWQCGLPYSAGGDHLESRPAASPWFGAYLRHELRQKSLTGVEGGSARAGGNVGLRIATGSARSIADRDLQGWGGRGDIHLPGSRRRRGDVPTCRSAEVPRCSGAEVQMCKRAIVQKSCRRGARNAHERCKKGAKEVVHERRGRGSKKRCR